MNILYELLPCNKIMTMCPHCQFEKNNRDEFVDAVSVRFAC